jgi:signal transduction histidine kinase
MARARLVGGELRLTEAAPAAVDGDPLALAQALDNLIVNAIEHGGPTIEVAARRHGRRLRIAVSDSGRVRRPGSRRGAPAEVLARLTGRRPRGHGLAVVRHVAAVHRGRFELRSSEAGSVAMLELPLAPDQA